MNKFFLAIVFIFSLAAEHDPYAWLEEMDSPAVWEWTEKQNETTNRYLFNHQSREAIENRVGELAAFDVMTLPIEREGHLYYTYLGPGKKQAVLRQGQNTLVDPNVLSEEGTVCLSAFEVNKEGTKVAYGLSYSGSDLQNWHFIDLESRKTLPDVLTGIKFNVPQWARDSRGVYYLKFISETKQGVFYHRLGTPQSEDLCLFVPAVENQLLLEPKIILEGVYLLLTIRDSLERENGLLLLNLKSGQLMEVVSSGQASCQFVNEWEGLIFVIENRRALLQIDPLNPAESKVIIPPGNDNLADAAVVGNRLVCHYMKHAVSELKVFTLEGKFLYNIELPGMGSVALSSGESTFYYSYTDFVSPSTIFQHSFEEVESCCVFRPSISWNPSDYLTEQVFFDSKDGTAVPMFVIRKKGMKTDKRTPALLYGYGGFNLPLTPGFSLLALSWLDSGGIYISVNLRGGGEYGPEWHDAGRGKNKQNVFDDFIFAAEWLVKNDYTSPEKLAINGRSNGGLLVGAALVQRPDLFGAAIPQVGVLDMLKFHQYTIGWCWKSEYGDPGNSEDRANLLSYSPLHNVRAGTSYPADFHHNK